MNSDRNSPNKLISFLENQSHWIIVLSVVTILCLTLLPFDFAIPYNFSLQYILDKFRQVTSWDDLVLNVFFFVPLGLGLAAFVHKRNRFNLQILIAVFLVSFCLSLLVEVCQLFLISRNSSFTDILTNSLGGILGGIIFLLLARFDRQVWQGFSFLKVFHNSFIKLKSLTIFWLCYFFLISFLLINVENHTDLSNWDLKYPLVIGNESTGDRSWIGQISYLCITEKSLSKEQIERQFQNKNSCTTLAQKSDDFIAAYSFLDSQKSYPELTQNLPELEQTQNNFIPVKDTGIVVDRENWLKTKIPVLKLTQKLQDSSQFTIFTKIATTNFKQEGPARIISLSQNHNWRNLTIAQWRKDLTIRVRMPLTGVNGKKPEIRIRNFFNDTNYHQLAIAYDGLRLRTYVDRIENAHKLYLGSEAALFWSVFAIIAEKMYLNVADDPFYHLLYYGFIFAPLGICLGLISNFLQTRLLGWLTLAIGGLIIPPFLIEGIIASNSNRFWNWNYLSLGITFITISFLLTKWLSHSQKLSLRARE
jgi:glycopeptide antibiotics resistance protein